MSTLKQQAADAAIAYVEEHRILGVGTGSTVRCFIDSLVKIRSRVEACVASSLATEAHLRSLGFPVIDLNSADEVPIYVDGADEIDALGQMIKGGGGALTREKILASVAQRYICIVDESKYVERLGSKAPVPVEVIPMARSFVAREIVKLGGNPIYRQGVVTDNGNCILDVYHLNLDAPREMERTLNQLTGVVENGLFIARRADNVCMAGSQGVTIT